MRKILKRTQFVFLMPHFKPWLRRIARYFFKIRSTLLRVSKIRWLWSVMSRKNLVASHIGHNSHVFCTFNHSKYVCIAKKKKYSQNRYSVSCHNRYHHCKYVATRLCDGATAISDASKCPPTEFKNYNDIFQIREKGQTNSQIKRLNGLRQALKLGHAKVPLPLLPDAYRSMSTYLCTYQCSSVDV